MRRPLLLPLLPVLAAGVLAACGDGDGEQACGPVLHERLDPGSSVHLLPGAEEPSYLSDPPTSGPHRAGPPPRGVHGEPLDRPSQVRALEQGVVVIQHRGLDRPARRALEGFAGEDVVVAPNPELPEPVVATAWLVKLSCSTVDADALRRFVDEHAGHGPE